MQTAASKQVVFEVIWGLFLHILLLLNGLNIDLPQIENLSEAVVLSSLGLVVKQEGSSGQSGEHRGFILKSGKISVLKINEVIWKFWNVPGSIWCG